MATLQETPKAFLKLSTPHICLDSGSLGAKKEKNKRSVHVPITLNQQQVSAFLVIKARHKMSD